MLRLALFATLGQWQSQHVESVSSAGSSPASRTMTDSPRYMLTKGVGVEKMGHKVVGLVCEAEKFGTFEKIVVVIPVEMWAKITKQVEVLTAS